MFPATSLCTALLVLSPAMGATAEDLANYEDARGKVGRNAEAHVELALWCAAHGLAAERTKHLALAVLIDPAHAKARGLMGLVDYRGRWRRPSTVAEEVRSDAVLAADLAEYNAQREKTPDTADAQWRLALWCEEHGLKGEARAHLTTVVGLDPSREAAWKRLGCKKVGGRWIDAAKIEADKAENQAQRQADKHWKPLLAKWRDWLGEKERQEEAREQLAHVRDARAVPSVVAVFESHRLRPLACRCSGRSTRPPLHGPWPGWPSPGDRPRSAARRLKHSAGADPREYAGYLVALLREPINYEVRPVGGPGSPGTIFVQGKPLNVARLYAPPPAPNVPVFSNDSITLDANGLPVITRYHLGRLVDETTWFMSEQDALKLARADLIKPILPAVSDAGAPGASQLIAALNQTASVENQAHVQGLEKRIEQQIAEGKSIAAGAHSSGQPTVNAHRSVFVQDQTRIPIGQMVLEAQRSAVLAQQQLQADVATLERSNQEIREVNERAAKVLNEATGQDRPADAKAWKDWWVDHLGYRSDTKRYSQPVPTLVENVPLEYVPQTSDTTVRTRMPGLLFDFRRISCFGAGTLVNTLSGPRPIETLRTGDRVLTQNLRTAALDYQPVLNVHHNPPSPTFSIHVSGETIVSSPFHRFWKAGRGWVMARDLKPGDTLGLLGGQVSVESVEEGAVQPVFNLDIAGGHNFFVGEGRILVHDNSLPDMRQPPFDAEPELTAIDGNRQ